MMRLLSFLLLFLCLPAMAQADPLVQTAAKQAIIIDYDTGMVLYEKNADERMPTSSMSKVMTMYMAFDALKKGDIKLDDTFRVSEKAWRMGGSKMFVEVGSDIKIQDLIRGVVVQSGNDATIVLAEGLAGSEGIFAGLMTQKARELGMNNSSFVNASGWPEPDHYSTARDLAILAMAMIRDFPEDYKYFSEIDFTYSNITQGNRNPLLYRNIGADGIKTGHTEDGGYGLIASGVYDGRRVVVVLNGLESQQQRADESAKLLEWGMKGFENRRLIVADRAVESLPVAMGQATTVSAVIKDDLFVTVPKMSVSNIKFMVEYKTPLIAPVKKGDEIGVLEVEVPYVGTVKRFLYAGEDVPKLGLFQATVMKIGRFLSEGK